MNPLQAVEGIPSEKVHDFLGGGNSNIFGNLLKHLGLDIVSLVYISILRGGKSNIFHFQPEIWGRFPFD